MSPYTSSERPGTANGGVILVPYVLLLRVEFTDFTTAPRRSVGVMTDTWAYILSVALVLFASRVGGIHLATLHPTVTHEGHPLGATLTRRSPDFPRFACGEARSFGLPHLYII